MTKVATKGLLKALVSEDAPPLFPICFLSRCLGSESAHPPTGREGLLYPTGLPNAQASTQVCPPHYPPKALPGSLSVSIPLPPSLLSCSLAHGLLLRILCACQLLPPKE